MNVENGVFSPSDLRPNPWNPRRMPKSKFEILKAYIQEVGLVSPIIGRRSSDGKIEILGGEHRWRAAKELGLERVEVRIVECPDDKQAKKLSVNLNAIEGRDDPQALQKVLADIAYAADVDSLVATMPFSKEEIDEALDKLRSDVLDEDPVEPGAQEAPDPDEVTRNRREVAYFVLPDSESLSTIEEALRLAIPGEGTERRGRALTAICSEYLMRRRPG